MDHLIHVKFIDLVHSMDIKEDNEALPTRLHEWGRCCINRFQAKLPQTPAVAMPRLPSEDGPVL